MLDIAGVTSASSGTGLTTALASVRRTRLVAVAAEWMTVAWRRCSVVGERQ